MSDSFVKVQMQGRGSLQVDLVRQVSLTVLTSISPSAVLVGPRVSEASSADSFVLLALAKGTAFAVSSDTPFSRDLCSMSTIHR